MGIVPSPLDCSMVNRSLKTLELRMQQHMKNGLAVAKFLESHPYVEKVIHPCMYLYKIPSYHLRMYLIMYLCNLYTVISIRCSSFF